MAADPQAQHLAPDREPWWRVERDDCNGRTFACVSCGQPNGGVHDVLCGTAANKTKEPNQ